MYCARGFMGKNTNKGASDASLRVSAPVYCKYTGISSTPSTPCTCSTPDVDSATFDTGGCRYMSPTRLRSMQANKKERHIVQIP